VNENFHHHQPIPIHHSSQIFKMLPNSSRNKNIDFTPTNIFNELYSTAGYGTLKEEDMPLKSSQGSYQVLAMLKK
jgi:hypothetical protein